MKKIISFLSVVLLGMTVSAQERLKFFDLVYDVFGNNLTLTQFQERYKPYIAEREDDVKNVFSLEENIDFLGYIGASIVQIYPEYNLKIVTGMPKYEALDSVSRYESAKKCHQCMIEVFGHPQKEEALSVDDIQQQEIAKAINVKGGIVYRWMPEGGGLISASIMNTDKEDRYMVTFGAMESPFKTTTPVQRKFFKTLEFGKEVTKYQIATALEISSVYLAEERTSSGRAYNCLKPIYFGGVEWSFIEFETVENLLSTVRLTHTQLNNNKDIFDSLFRVLSQKYGDTSIENNEAFWFDGQTAIILTYKYGKSKGGEMRHYVNLEYSDMALINKAQNLVTDEL